ncbi:MAG: BsuPI-related putative proteinase inhibitor [Candidatus Polarisedimenticolia bacterium]
MLLLLPVLLLMAAASGADQPPLTVSLATDRASYRSGEPIELRLTVTNTADIPVDLHFNNSQRYDFQIHSATGLQLWSWAQERMFLQVLGKETFAPKESRVFTERFLGTLPAGACRVTGMLTAREPTPSAAATFTIE